ncbi:hypothetical protein FGL98_24315 [Leekyejoonella antrihumi]|uniref:Uncharacterized protein n=2 Tax=Leekyejoonella antrihumi TaxID=1660198 RepID=A0A563DQ58_9MICO|nr:hypothetical protein FGL98_24315 [Leekyejoonella antrihumi]
MQSRGVLPEDAPDPRVEHNRRLRDMPSPVMGLIVQPSLEDTDSIGISDGSDGAGYTEFSVSITYTLWRNPADRSDPVNLAVLDHDKRAAIEMATPWPRPAWLIEQVQRMRYPQLWEAVRTTWSRDLTAYTTLAQRLVDHANDILNNQYRDPSIRPGFPPAPRVTESSVNPAVTVAVDGVATPAAEIDTDPFVYAIGAETAPRTVVTAVLPRSELQHIRIAFATGPTVAADTR